jgi:hypothetical protein
VLTNYPILWLKSKIKTQSKTTPRQACDLRQQERLRVNIIAATFTKIIWNELKVNQCNHPLKITKITLTIIEITFYSLAKSNHDNHPSIVDLPKPLP